MQTEQLNIKLMPELAKEVDLIASILHIPKADWVRNVLAHQVKKELEEHKAYVALEYTKGKFSKKELISALGKADSEDVEFIAKTTKKGFEDAKALAKAMK
jgi:predicted transcriptional regulator